MYLEAAKTLKDLRTTAPDDAQAAIDFAVKALGVQSDLVAAIEAILFADSYTDEKTKIKNLVAARLAYEKALYL